MATLAVGCEPRLARVHEVPRAAYRAFALYHYRSPTLGPTASLWCISDGIRDVGIVVYAYAGLACRARRNALPQRFWGGPLDTRLACINKDLRILQRLVVLPHARGLGYGRELVRRTLGLLGVTYVEAIAVNPGVLVGAGMHLIEEREESAFGELRQKILRSESPTESLRKRAFREWRQSHGSHLRREESSARNIQERFQAALRLRTRYLLWANPALTTRERPPYAA